MRIQLGQFTLSPDDLYESVERLSVYALLDAAGAPAVVARLDDPALNSAALYESRRQPNLRDTAPHLVRLDVELLAWMEATLWLDPWGILIETDVELRLLRKHLRRFLLVEKSDGRIVYFRYYDPRVLNTFLPTCRTTELTDFFGPVQAFIARRASADEFTRFALVPAPPPTGRYTRLRTPPRPRPEVPR